MSFATFELKGRFDQFGGSVTETPVPLAGVLVRVTASVPDVPVDGATTVLWQQLAETDEDGAFSLDVPAALGEDFAITGWTTQVEITVPGQPVRTPFSIAAQEPGTVLDLIDVIPVPADPGEELEAWTQLLNQVQTLRNGMIVGAEVNEDGDLILATVDGQTLNAGLVIGPQGPVGEVTLAAMNAALGSKADLQAGRVPYTQLPAALAVDALNGTIATVGGISALPATALAGLAITHQFDEAQSVYGARPAALRRYRAKAAAAITGSAVCRILCLGDSTTAGKPASGVNRGVSDYPTYLRKMLAAAGRPIAGTGLVPASQAETTNPDFRFTFTGTWADANFYRQSSTVGARATFTSDLPGTAVEIVVSRFGTAANWRYRIDGGAWVDVAGVTTGSGTIRTTVTGLADTTHIVDVEQNATGGVRLWGIEVRKASGISVTNVGIGGSTTSGWNTSTTNGNLSGLAIPPDLVLINLGINDYFTSVALATFKTRLTETVNVYLPTADVALAVSNPVTAVYSPAKSEYDRIVYEVAEATGVPVLDLTAQWGTGAGAQTVGLLHADGTHPTPSGDAEIAAAWYSAIASESASSEGQLSATIAAEVGRTVRQVGTRSKIPSDITSGPKQSMSSSWHFIMSPITRIQLGYAAWRAQGNADEIAAGSAVTIRATIEYPTGTITRVQFGGSDTGTIPDGTTLLSDWLPITIPAGAKVLIRTWTSCASGALTSSIPQSFTGPSAGDSCNVGTTTSDLTGGGAITNNVSGSVYSPCLILGDSTAPAVFIAGDSRVVGSTDAIVDGLLNAGDIARAVGQKYAYVNAGRGGDTATAAAASYTRRAALAAYCTEAVVGYGINDLITRGLSASNTMAAIASLLAQLPNYRRRVLTISPVSTSTDGWATTANQTTHATNANRVTTNNGIRYCTIAGQSGFIEVADFVESARDSGIWKAGFTVDGVHSNVTADTAIAAGQSPLL